MQSSSLTRGEIADFGRKGASLAGPDDRATRERLDAYSVLDTARETSFDRVVFMAAQMFRVPIAVVALRDGDRLWFKAQVGLALTEIPSAIAFCNAITQESVMVIEDATMDPRFAGNPLVTGAPHVRFYAGAPLITPDGLRIGSLCVVDRSPKTMLARQVWQLTQLAQSVVATLEARRPS